MKKLIDDADIEVVSKSERRILKNTMILILILTSTKNT